MHSYAWLLRFTQVVTLKAPGHICAMVQWRSATEHLISSLNGLEMTRRRGQDAEAKYMLYAMHGGWALTAGFNKGWTLGMAPRLLTEYRMYHFIFNT
jgi:hypothetical protein